MNKDPKPPIKKDSKPVVETELPVDPLLSQEDIMALGGLDYETAISVEDALEAGEPPDTE